MSANPHFSDDLCELLEIIALDSQGILLEERDDPVHELEGAVHGVDRYGTPGSLQSHTATSEERGQGLEGRDVVYVLRNLKGGLDVPTRGWSG